MEGSVAGIGTARAADHLDWWRGAVIYQIYPRSFQDSDGDGVGDLRGITQRLDYVADLGVDAVWISPFFKSPMKDFGYDVSDYRAVDPMFGSLADFDALVDRAHALGLKVVIDLVFNHTSDQHVWFGESRQSRDNPKADWYVWADPKPDGTPPSNWQSVFGGPAWSWEPRRGQYYLHNFLASQPDLNFHNEDMIDALLAEAEFWLERGIDGFRLDTANYFLHDAALRDNPPNEQVDVALGQVQVPYPYLFQRHVYDKSRPENLHFLGRLRALTEQYPGCLLLGEVSDDDSLKTAAAYSRGGDHLHMCYTFAMLVEAYSAVHFRGCVEELEKQLGDGWHCWAFSNHDVVRPASRWQRQTPSAAQAKMLHALLLSLRGSICLYQGEELGLAEAKVPLESMQDPFGLALYPQFKGRDGCRTPMPWDAEAPNGGFSAAEPWLPVPPEHLAGAVSVQAGETHSILENCRRLLRWRRGHPALVAGSIRFHPAPQPVLAFERRRDSDGLLCLFNLEDQQVDIMKSSLPACTAADGHGLAWQQTANRIILPPFGVFFGSLTETSSGSEHG